jgi:hypothetical protein
MGASWTLQDSVNRAETEWGRNVSAIAGDGSGVQRIHMAAVEIGFVL